MTGKRKRIVLVNYLNTLPFLKGITDVLADEVDVILAHPADCAKILFSGEADYGLVPVGALKGRSDWHRITNYGIASDGAVETVCLFGNTPLNSWKKVYMDYQSRTSVELARILLSRHWKQVVELKEGTPGYEFQVEDGAGALIIGDRAIDASKRFEYRYDLGHAWKAFTGLPFVFAAWVGKKNMDTQFESDLNRALLKGLDGREDLVATQQASYPLIDLKHYFSTTIQYKLEPNMLKGMELFLSLIH